ncbi:putative oxidoreductase [Lachnellula hyalina]|uniref:Putative oxidoreductase n=1 Tax=Lachnellula hyalina TaxID=1316788 RepID=A0A8H8R384_9HELO|nr:putative oxidoreductase [Lachnellula hyalina]TVY27548.1 putative oxidoreductase [Lachnellula hyalina]
MTATTHPEFNDKTEALEVASAFAERIRGKTILVTGVNRGGIGYTTAEAFASQSPAHIIIAGRNESKLKESISALHAQFPSVDYRPLKVDFSSQKSVRAAAAEVISSSDVPSIDIIVNNAGIMHLPERTLSEDDIEMHFATNHIGHFLLTCLLVPKLLKAKGARVVNVSSASLMLAQGIRWSDIHFSKPNKDLPLEEQPLYEIHRAWGATGDLEEKSYLPLEGYNQSKIANVLFAIATTKRLHGHGVLSLAVHPGVIQTELTRNMGTETLNALDDLMKTGLYQFRTTGAGAATSLVAALDPKLGAGEVRGGKENYGTFLADCQINDGGNPRTVSSEEAEKLWALSEELVKEKFEWQ